MTIPFGRLNVTITLSRAPERHKGWEEMMAIGMNDLDLARLNQANSRDPVHSPWTGVRWLYGPPR